jgi:hypothetical protein
VIKYKKGTTNKLVDFLSKPPTPKITALGAIMHMEPFTHEAYKEEYVEDEDFKGCINNYKEKRTNANVDYHLQDGLLYKMGKALCTKGRKSTTDKGGSYLQGC